MSNVAEELPGLRGTFNGNPDEVVHALSAGRFGGCGDMLSSR
jgi:hypothetical protein